MKEKRTGYLNAWQKEHKDRINYLVDKGFKAEIKVAADAAGQSLNAYITGAVQERMRREGRSLSSGTGG